MAAQVEWAEVMLRSIQGATLALALRGVPREKVVDAIDRAYEVRAKLARVALDIGGRI